MSVYLLQPDIAIFFKLKNDITYQAANCHFFFQINQSKEEVFQKTIQPEQSSAIFCREIHERLRKSFLHQRLWQYRLWIPLFQLLSFSFLRHKLCSSYETRASDAAALCLPYTLRCGREKTHARSRDIHIECSKQFK